MVTYIKYTKFMQKEDDTTAIKKKEFQCISLDQKQYNDC